MEIVKLTQQSLGSNLSHFSDLFYEFRMLCGPTDKDAVNFKKLSMKGIGSQHFEVVVASQRSTLPVSWLFAEEVMYYHSTRLISWLIFFLFIIKEMHFLLKILEREMLFFDT